MTKKNSEIHGFFTPSISVDDRIYWGLPITDISKGDNKKEIEESQKNSTETQGLDKHLTKAKAPFSTRTLEPGKLMINEGSEIKIVDMELDR